MVSVDGRAMLLDILGEVVSDIYRENAYNLPETIDEAIAGLLTDYTPEPDIADDLTVYEKFDSSNTDDVYGAKKPQTGTQTLIPIELETEYSKYITALKFGDIAGILTYANTVLELVQETYGTNSDVVESVYDVVGTGISILANTIVTEQELIEGTDVVPLLTKLIKLSGTIDVDLVIDYLATVLSFLYIVYRSNKADSQNTNDRTVLTDFVSRIGRNRTIVSAFATDMLESMAIKYAKELATEKTGSEFVNFVQSRMRTFERLLVFAGLVRTETLDAIFSKTLDLYWPDIVDRAKYVLYMLDPELSVTLTDNTDNKEKQIEQYLATIDTILQAILLAHTDICPGITETALDETEPSDIIKCIEDIYEYYVTEELSEALETDTYDTEYIPIQEYFVHIDDNVEELLFGTDSVYTEAKKTNGYVTDFTIHEHKAHRAGLHYDLRIRVGQKVMSIAFRKPIVALDKGTKRQGFIQPIHTKRWLTFEGEIESGYGAGTLKIIAQGTVEVYKTTRGNIVMHFIDKKNNKEYWYAFIKTESDKTDKRYHPVLLIPIDSKKESEHLLRPTIQEILEYFGYVPGSDLMSVEVDV